MLRFVQNLFGGESKPAKRKRRPAKFSSCRALGVESLETRDLMAFDFGLVTPAAIVSQQLQVDAPAVVTVSLENKDLVIRGTNGPDDVAISYANGKYTIKVTTEVNGKAHVGTAVWKVPGGDVFFYGNNGNDKFSANNTSLRVTAFGGDGDDLVLGSNAKDKLNGGNGSDTLRGGPGADTINGDAGDDFLYGGNNNDVMDGGLNSDHIWGDLGDDTITGGDDFAPNEIFGGYGHDKLTGGKGADYLAGEDGNDSLFGGWGADELYGGNGHDMLDAGMDYSGNYLDGGAGNDHLYGGLGADILLGQGGKDWLYGGAGDDQLRGGDVDCVDHLYAGTGDDKLYGDWEDIFRGQAGKDTFTVDFPWLHPFNPGRYVHSVNMDREPGEIRYEGYFE